MSKKNKYSKIDFKAQVKFIKPINPEFDLVKIYVQSVGKNRNMTYMSKKNIQKFLDTLNYCPVVGHIIEGENKETGEKMSWMGGHDSEIDWETWTIKDLTVPFGVVIDDSYEFEMVDEYGTEVEYLTANAILWTGRYEQLKDCIYSEDFWFNQSMEISINQWKPLDEDSNYTEILDWNYSALCLLGKADEDSTTGHTDKEMHTEPCFISACVIPVEFSKSEFSELINEMKEKLSFCFNNQSSDESISTTENTEEVDIEKTNNGGKSMTEEVKNDVVEEVTEPVVDEETVDENKEEPTVDTPETEEAPADDTSSEPTDEVTDEVNDDTDEDFSTKYAELKTQYETLEKEFSDYKAEHSFLNSDYESLKLYKENKEIEERKCAEDALFAKYKSSIGDTDEFVRLKESASEYTLDALEKECLCVVGKYAFTTKKETKETKPLKFSVENKESIEDKPYGGLMEKYLHKESEEK